MITVVMTIFITYKGCSVHGTKMYVTVQYVYIVTRGSELMFIGVIHLTLMSEVGANLLILANNWTRLSGIL